MAITAERTPGCQKVGHKTHTRLSESRAQNYIDSLCQHSNMLTNIFTDMKLINL